MATCNFVFWDVQHGSACYIETPNGTRMAVDLGTGSYAAGGAEFSPLLHLKNRYGVNQLDAVLITHPHTDHIDDILNFDALSPRVLCRPRHLPAEAIRAQNRSEDNRKVEKYLEINDRYSGQVVSSPFAAENNGGVDMRIFSPRSASVSNINNHSLVLVAAYAQSKIVIPGDNEPPSWKELLDDPAFREAVRDTDVFLASHHGRESGFHAELFGAMGNPRLTIISDGRFLDTSCTPRYSSVTRGWAVFKRSNGSREERKCVTTRNDGAVHVRLGMNEERPFIHVTIA